MAHYDPLWLLWNRYTLDVNHLTHTNMRTKNVGRIRACFLSFSHSLSLSLFLSFSLSLSLSLSYLVSRISSVPTPLLPHDLEFAPLCRSPWCCPPSWWYTLLNVCSAVSNSDCASIFMYTFIHNIRLYVLPLDIQAKVHWVDCGIMNWMVAGIISTRWCALASITRWKNVIIHFLLLLFLQNYIESDCSWCVMFHDLHLVAVDIDCDIAYSVIHVRACHTHPHTPTLTHTHTHEPARCLGHIHT